MLILVSAQAIAQDVKEAVAIDYINGLLSQGNHKLEILEKDISPDLKQIVLRYRKAVSDSMEWYQNYSQENKNQNPLPYHVNFGISQAEYERMNREFPLQKMKIKSSRTLTVNKAEDKINFKGDGDFTIFNTVAIDTKNKTMIVDDQLIPYAGEFTEGETSGFGSWKGYRWKLESGNMDDIKAFKQTDYNLIDITIGKTLETNKIVVQYKTISVESGTPRINGSLTGYLN